MIGNRVFAPRPGPLVWGLLLGGTVLACTGPSREIEARTAGYARPTRGVANGASDAGELTRPYYQRGLRVLWRDDFANYEHGALLRGVELESGRFEIVNIDGRNFLETVEGGVLILILAEALPRRFSVEFEYESPNASGPFRIDAGPGSAGRSCLLGSLGHESFVECDGRRTSVVTDLPEGGRIHPRFTLDGEHLSAYINEQLLPPLPGVSFRRGKRLRLSVPAGTAMHPTRLTVIDVAGGGETWP